MANNKSVIEQTIAGGWTRDTLREAYGHLIDAQAEPLVLLLNAKTIGFLYEDIAAITGRPAQPAANLTEAVQRMLVSEAAFAKLYVTPHRDLVPNNQLRIFASDGRLYIFNFV